MDRRRQRHCVKERLSRLTNHLGVAPIVLCGLAEPAYAAPIHCPAQLRKGSRDGVGVLRGGFGVLFAAAVGAGLGIKNTECPSINLSADFSLPFGE